MNFSDIIRRSDNRSKNRATRQSIVAKLYKVEDNRILYTVTSSEGDKQYLVTIQLLGLTSNKLRSLKAALNGDLRIKCSCDAFLFMGYKYITYKANVGIDKETRPPNKTNPNREGMACKHIIAALNQMKSDYSVIYNKFKAAQPRQSQPPTTPSSENKPSPEENKDSDEYTETDLETIDSFRESCMRLYDLYTKYKNSNPPDDSTFIDSDYYDDINPSNFLGNLSKPCTKEIAKSFIGKLKSLDDILYFIDLKRNGFTVMLKSDVERLIRKINSELKNSNESLINSIILDLLDYS